MAEISIAPPVVFTSVTSIRPFKSFLHESQSTILKQAKMTSGNFFAGREDLYLLQIDAAKDVINSQGEAMIFSDILMGVCRAEWNALLNILSHFSFTHHFDKLSWQWSASGEFNVHSLYLILNYRGILPEQPLLWWLLPVPPKIKIFMWLTFRNKILTRTNLIKKGWDGPNHCVFCTLPETVNHLFLHCVVTKQIWHWLGQSQGVYQNWRSLKDVFHFAISLTPCDRFAFLIVFSATCWTIWKHRNEICFQHVSPKSVRSLLYLIISLVSYWTGSSKIKQKVKDATHKWLPDMDAVPLRVIWPGDEESESFHLPASSTESVCDTPTAAVIANYRNIQ